MIRYDKGVPELIRPSSTVARIRVSNTLTEGQKRKAREAFTL